MEVIVSSNNMYRDFGSEYPGLKLLRADLASEIVRVLREKDLTVRAAEALTGVPAADFSRIRQPDLGRFTVDRLAKILWKLGVDFDATLATGPRVDPPAR